jgi:hypothetical protein
MTADYLLYQWLYGKRTVELEKATEIYLRDKTTNVTAFKKAGGSLEDWKQHIASRVEYAKYRIGRGLYPVCGLRLMVPGSATVVADVPIGEPWVSFCLDSRDPEFYAVAIAAAKEVVNEVFSRH